MAGHSGGAHYSTSGYKYNRFGRLDTGFGAADIRSQGDLRGDEPEFTDPGGRYMDFALDISGCDRLGTLFRWRDTDFGHRCVVLDDRCIDFGNDYTAVGEADTDLANADFDLRDADIDRGNADINRGTLTSTLRTLTSTAGTLTSTLITVTSTAGTLTSTPGGDTDCVTADVASGPDCSGLRAVSRNQDRVSFQQDTRW